MPLTNTAIKNARSQAKAYKLTDGKGLYARNEYWDKRVLKMRL